MKSSMTQATHREMIIKHLPAGRQVRDSPEGRNRHMAAKRQL
ncbi:MAG: hypothetical protein WD431_24115 [Cyclobacteriaceae bacterium]